MTLTAPLPAAPPDLGQVWGATTREECVATVREAVESGINVLDLAPTYGNGEAESVVGEAFDGALPDGVRITTKCRVGDTPPEQVYDLLSNSLEGSLGRMKLERVDVMFLHNAVTLGDEGGDRLTPVATVVEGVGPAFERLIAEGRIGHWGLTGIGNADALIHLLTDGPRPGYMQCITNLLDSAGGLFQGTELPRPRDVIAAANANGVAVLGIRAVQAGALTDAIDRTLPEGHTELADFTRAAPFRAIAADEGQSAAFLAHRYALSMEGVSTVVLGVKNLVELRECIEGEDAGPLDPALMARIDLAVGRGGSR